MNREFVSQENYDREWVLKGMRSPPGPGSGWPAFTARILMLFLRQRSEEAGQLYSGGHHRRGHAGGPQFHGIEGGQRHAGSGGRKGRRITAVADVLKYDGYFREVETFCPEGISRFGQGRIHRGPGNRNFIRGS